jgi:microcompartment protein CcmL/EutN
VEERVEEAAKVGRVLCHQELPAEHHEVALVIEKRHTTEEGQARQRSQRTVELEVF